MRLVSLPSPGNRRNDNDNERPAQRAPHRAEAELASTLGGRERRARLASERRRARPAAWSVSKGAGERNGVASSTKRE